MDLGEVVCRGGGDNLIITTIIVIIFFYSVKKINIFLSVWFIVEYSICFCLSILCRFFWLFFVFSYLLFINFSFHFIVYHSSMSLASSSLKSDMVDSVEDVSSSWLLSASSVAYLLIYSCTFLTYSSGLW